MKYLSVLLFLLVFVGCQKLPPQTATKLGARNAQTIMVERRIKDAEKSINSVKGMAHIVLSDPKEERETDIAIVMVRPDKLRADAIDSIADVWASVGTNGERLWLWLPHKDKLYRGSATQRNLKKLADFNWGISELVSIASGLVPSASDVELYESPYHENGHYIIKDSPIHLWVDSKTKQIIRLVRVMPHTCDHSPDEALQPAFPCPIQYDVKFSDYKKTDGILFPHEIDAKFSNSEFYLRYYEVEINAEINKLLFDPKTIWQEKTVKIDK